MESATHLLALRYLTVLVVLYSTVATVAYAGDKAVYPGAIISVRGHTRSFGAVNKGLPEVTPIDMTAERIAPGVVHLDTRISSKRLRDSGQPRAYASVGNPCRRAKVRRILRRIPGHATCSPNWALTASRTPNDQYHYLQYGSGLMSLPTAWDYTTGSDSLLALVIDTGVSYSHPDLAPNMWRNPGEIEANGIDDDKNGYIDDVYGINAINGSGDPNDDNGHGTHAAGILGARGNNSIGSAGVAWNTKIVAAKFLNSSGSGSVANAIKSIQYGNALKRAGYNVVVSNNSWGGSGYSPALASAILESSNLGILFVAAAGNESANNDAVMSYPASYSIPNVVSVASVGSDGALSSFSNYGASSVHIAAPGNRIVSSYPNSSYVLMSGTSMAAPQVSGVALLAQAICNGSLTLPKLKDALLKTGTVYPSLQGKTISSSIVNALGAVQSAQSQCAPTPTPTAAPSSTPGTPLATATPTPILSPSALPTSAPTALHTPTATATSTPQQPTPRPTSTQTPTATRTMIPTQTATRIPTAAPTQTAKPTLTPTAAATSPGSVISPRIALSPQPSVQAGSSFTISAGIPQGTKVSNLAVVLVNSTGTRYPCNPINLRSSTASINQSVRLTNLARFFSGMTVSLLTDGTASRDSVSISNSQSSYNPRVDRTLAASVCTSIQTQLSWASSRGRYGVQRVRRFGSRRTRR